MGRKRNMPSKKMIKSHWLPLLGRWGKSQPILKKRKVFFESTELFPGEDQNFYNPVFIDFCFACGLVKETQRSHIAPVSLDGSDNLENLHLLCVTCHYESEGLSGEPYWDWFNSKDEHLALRHFEEGMYNRTRSVTEKLLKIKPEAEWTREELAQYLKENVFNQEAHIMSLK